MLLKRSNRLRPAETHATERLYRFHVVLDRRRRILNDLLLGECRNWRRILFFLFPSDRQADLKGGIG